MRTLAIATSIAILAGCTTARPMMVPSGAQGFKIWCELPSQCYERAATVCPHGYTVEANEKDYWGLGDVDGNLFITCKQPGQAQVAPALQAPAKPAEGTNSAPTPASNGDCVACRRIGNP